MGSETAFETLLDRDEIAAANDLTRRWFASRDEPPAVASALGIWPLLTALASGAIGETRSELLAAAGVGPTRESEVADAVLGAAKYAPAIRLAVAVWAGSRITLDPEWIAKLPTESVGALTGDAALDKEALDAWAARESGGLIEEMPLNFNVPIDLVLASALSVRTTWTTPFRDSSQPFRTGPWAGLGPCRRLSATLNEDVVRTSDLASVLTVSGGKDIDVLLAIGREDLTAGRVMSELIDASADPHWGRHSGDMQVGEQAPGVEITEYRSSKPQLGPEVDVQTVRFSLESDLDLLEDSTVLGLVLASDEEQAQFDRLAAERTYVSQAKQTCVATFSATGFEAAAVTAMAMTRAAGVPKMEHKRVRTQIAFDRPFAYLARHRGSGLILVAGWVDEPETAG
ncbi:serpin family protein [Glycomyces buryatensis]|uniref:Proteinase inhibitor I4 serpin n=1 Tax=Glycomyces buryatensis TaxID=2570927 RepID=A0A4V6T6H0_9ACTN|nr:serpin family protein [Glycomyces buryatensis]THV32906.1 proteinase inhibitor I4 serpin [Glycomyces buryatensis]